MLALLDHSKPIEDVIELPLEGENPIILAHKMYKSSVGSKWHTCNGLSMLL